MSKQTDKIPQLFIDDGSGEGWQLFGSASDAEMASQNAMAYIQVAIDVLLSDGEETMCLTFKRQDMTEKEVADLPEV